MPLRVSGIRLPTEATEDEVHVHALRRAGLEASDVSSIAIVRRSLDRRHGAVAKSFVVDLHIDSSSRFFHRRSFASGDLRWIEPAAPEAELRGETRLQHPPVVVGTGPAGLFAALVLSRAGFRPIVLERGDPMNIRARKLTDFHQHGTLDRESHYLFGEGGAGTFSDGKLTSRSKDPRSDVVLSEFREKSGVPQVTFDYRPHLGSDRVRAVVGRIRQELLRLGASLRFRCRATGLVVSGGTLRAVETTEGEIPAQVLIAAPGHSARDFLRSLGVAGVAMEPKPFQLGLRVEHPQAFVDRAILKDPERRRELCPADYRIAAPVDSASVFSFCMCPGGEIIPAISDEGHLNSNGMSWSKRDTPFANSGIVTTLEPSDFGIPGTFGGMELQERYEALAREQVGQGFALPAQRLVDFLEGRLSGSLPETSCRTGVQPGDLRGVLPPLVARRLLRALPVFDRQMRGFLVNDAVLVGPESRSSSPVRIPRNVETMESVSTEGLYPAGEGAGYAGGIVSAAVDGMRAADAIRRRFAPSQG